MAQFTFKILPAICYAAAKGFSIAFALNPILEALKMNMFNRSRTRTWRN